MDWRGQHRPLLSHRYANGRDIPAVRCSVGHTLSEGEKFLSVAERNAGHTDFWAPEIAPLNGAPLSHSAEKP